MLISLINNKKYLSFNLKEEPDFLFITFLVKSYSRIVCANLLAKIIQKNYQFLLILLHRHNFRAKRQISTCAFFSPHFDNGDAM